MTLLIDALKKAGQRRQDGDGGTQSPASAHEGLTGAEQAAASAQRDAGKMLFAAKIAPIEGRVHLGIIPLALIVGTVLAALGGGYVWYQIKPRPALSYPAATSKPAPPPAPLAATTPPMAPPAPAEPAPAAIASEEMAAATPTPQPEPEEQERLSAPTVPGQSIRIQRRQETSSIDPMLASAYQAYQQGDYATAQQRYAAVLKQDPRNRDALLGIAALAQQQGANDIAIRYYEHVLELDPHDAVANAGMAALNQDASSSEESRIKLLLAQQPQSAALNFALGNLYAEQQRWPESQQAYFNAYRQQPDSAEYALNLAVSLDHLGQAKAAAQYYQRALQLDASGSAGFDHAQVTQRLNALKAP